MTTLAELKRRKEIEVLRVNESFVSNEDKMNNLEKEAEANGYVIKEKEINGNCVNYVFFSPNLEDELRFYVGKDEKEQKERTKRILEIHTDIISHEVEGEYLYGKVKGKKIHHSLILNGCFTAKEQAGVLKFRSKDYVFIFKDANDEEHKVYGDTLKASQIQGNKIIIDDTISYLISIK